MTRDDEDLLDGQPVTAEERAQARALARLTDALLEGQSAPPALAIEQRELLEAATTIRAALKPQRLEPTRRERLLASLPSQPRNRHRLRRAAPWALTLLAAAAALVLALRPPRPAPRADVPLSQRSRPADALIGRIDPSAAADASTRIDLIYADRLAGYRAALLRKKGVR